MTAQNFHPHYIDLDDLESAIREIVRAGLMTPGREGGFAHVVREFVPEWSPATCDRYVTAVIRDEREQMPLAVDMPVHPLDYAEFLAA